MVASQVQKELFKKWLKENRNISKSTFISYTEGVLDKIHEVIRLSNNALLKNLNPDLYSYDTLDKYDKFFNILKNDPNFDIVNKTGQAQSGWLSTPLNHYRRFLEYQISHNTNLNNFDINELRNNLIQYYIDKGLTTKNNSNHTALVLNKNIVEVHFVNKHNKQFKIAINYDLIDKNLLSDVRKVPETHKWTLDGEYWVTSLQTYYKAIDIINSILTNLNIVQNNSSKITNTNIMTNQPLNQILYGPPGTGKTYNTVIKAIEITNPELIQKDKDGNIENYEVLKNKFDELKQQGQIEFVTFHQSYSYEEFVEGIKPEIPKWNDEGSELKYVGKDGIFKNICEHAKPIKVSSIKHPPIDFSNTKVFKMSLGNTLEKEDDIYEYCISHNVVALGFKDVDFSDCKTSQDFKDKDDSWGATALERFVNWMDIGDIIIVSNGNRNFRAIAQVTGNYYYDRTTPIRYSHFRKVEWLYKGEDIYYSKINNKVFSQQSIYGYFDPSKKGMPNYNPDLNTQELNNIITGKVDKEIALPHILIIDEINRGNISKIFGELITLIEEDKRGTLSVKLPYSQDDFTVPKNLYIIGTMNTSDRSIASIDIALRRRFKFVEMMPRPELVADFGCDFQSIFEKLNTKIKILLDRDHQIGHSYFINTKYANANVNTLKEIWFSEIIPLLNEYFYCDWEKLKLVIPGFIKEINIPEELKNECEDSMYEFKTPNEVKDFVGVLKQDKFKQEN